MVPEAMRTSINPVIAKLGGRMYLESDYDESDPYKLLVERTLEGTHTLIVATFYLEWTIRKKGITHLTYLLDEKLFPSSITWFLRKNSPFTATISSHVTRLLETGVVAKLYSNHMKAVNVVPSSRKEQGDRVLNMEHLQGGFILLVLGLVSATLTFFLERLNHQNPTH
ncbi:hypothetical protein Pmani_019293 [Petrolisthes manimaculis]|uniref:Uncharacterized protein n=1 Tax=Petrolisthes manimaculis TaxID=1843537 RepID=A0AAE1U3N4_9EUCA|nr:hypothetical protein Pmani_019293 [Petrolisthes manimaculis]